MAALTLRNSAGARASHHSRTQGASTASCGPCKLEGQAPLGWGQRLKTVGKRQNPHAKMAFSLSGCPRALPTARQRPHLHTHTSKEHGPHTRPAPQRHTCLPQPLITKLPQKGRARVNRGLSPAPRCSSNSVFNSAVTYRKDLKASKVAKGTEWCLALTHMRAIRKTHCRSRLNSLKLIETHFGNKGREWCQDERAPTREEGCACEHEK